MITAIELENFKGVGHRVRIPIRPITLLFGANSAGKSTILHALHYAYEILAHRNADADITERGGEHLNLGGFRNLVHGRDTTKRIALAFELDLEERDLPTYGGPDAMDISSHVKAARIEIEVGWSEAEQKAVPLLYKVSINGEEAGFLNLPNGEKYGAVAQYNMGHPIVKNLWDDVENFDILSWEPIQIDRLFSVIPNWKEKLQYIEDSNNTYIPDGDYVLSQVLVGVGEIFTEYLAKMRYIGPIRKILPRNYERVISRHDTRWFDGTAAWDTILHASDSFVGKVGTWLEDSERLNTGYGIKIQRYREVDMASPFALSIGQGTLTQDIDDIKQAFMTFPERRKVRIVDANTRHEYSLYDLGVGISQLTPVVITALHPATKLMVVEQPELHIHPKVQTGLGDLFISQANLNAERESQFLIETHSEHLILRILRRIREFNEGEPLPDELKISHEDLSIVYVENADEGVSITPIGVNETGEFTNRWPKGFFDERAEELF